MRRFLVFILVLLFIHTIGYFPEKPDGLLFFDVVITTPGLDRIYNVLQLLYKNTEFQE